MAQDYIIFTCNNPGSDESFCSDETSERIVEECEFGCFEGECSEECYFDLECDDDNLWTYDQCIDNHCSHIDLECLSDNDCEDEESEPYCFDNDLYIDIFEGFCYFPGFCDFYEPFRELFEDCTFFCLDDECVECIEDEDCDDGYICDENFECVWPQCDDGIDNDNDGFYDYPADPQCESRQDNDESQ